MIKSPIHDLGNNFSANKSTNSFGGRGGLTKGVGRGRGQAIDVGDSPGASKITGPANGRGRGRGETFTLSLYAGQFCNFLRCSAARDEIHAGGLHSFK